MRARRRLLVENGYEICVRSRGRGWRQNTSKAEQVTVSRPDRDKERQDAIRRDMMWAGVAVLAFVALGAFLTFLSGDAARIMQDAAGLFWDRPAPVLAETPQSTRPVEIKGCKYCLTLKKIQHDFAKKAENARQIVDAAKKAPRSGAPAAGNSGSVAGASPADIAAATESLERFSSAADALTPFVAACEQESFCSPGYLAELPKTCSEDVSDAGLRGPAAGMAAVAREAALACIAQSCPVVDCAAVGNLRQDLIEAADAMSVVGEPVAVSKGQPRLKDLPVGPATLSSEVAKAIKEVEFAAQNYPSLIERPSGAAQQRPSQKSSMAEDLVSRQTEQLRSIADVMAQAAVVTPFSLDARREAAWRMKSLSLSTAEAGRMSSHDLLNGQEGKAYRIALSQNWGAALVDLAALSAMYDRLNAHAATPQGCNGQTSSAAQGARDAAALLDICRARAACPVGLPQRTVARSIDAARQALAELIPRAQASGDVLAASLGQAASQTGNELTQAAVVLNAGGVCQAGQAQ